MAKKGECTENFRTIVVSESGGVGLPLFAILPSSASGAHPPRNQAAHVYQGVIEVYAGLGHK